MQLLEGSEWYIRAYHFARSLSSDVKTAAGVIAALSPRQSWEYNVKLAERAFTDIGLVEGAFSANIEKANRILHGEDPEIVMATAKKTLNFYRSIAEPFGNHVTIDVWAARVATGFWCLDADMKAMKRKGVYESFADAYREAASIHNIPVTAMQAITWGVRRDEGKK
jgi:hypothetical protein